MSFENNTEMIIKFFSTLDKDEDEKLSNQQKVNAIINGIKFQDVQLMVYTLYIAGHYPRDVTMACAYFSREVARIHGSAQVAGQKIAASDVESTQQTVVVAAVFFLVTADVNTDDYLE